ncbi:MAG: hypothetical protein ACI9E1_001047 [Cryomorphaceae bacterium]|jgi:hypothetical protein
MEPARRIPQQRTSRNRNNSAENAVRPTKLGMKNWLFLGGADARHTSAKLYTIIENCKRHGLTPEAYLKEVLTHLPANPTQEGVASLTPSAKRHRKGKGKGKGKKMATQKKQAPNKVDFETLTNILPRAEKIVLVIDNLNTHEEASLYEAFPADKARQLCERFEIHYTPKHENWLNMAEMEISLLVGGRLDRRISSKKELKEEVEHYLNRKNSKPVPIKWQFTNKDARIKRHSIYPSF